MSYFYVTADGEEFCSNEDMNSIQNPTVTREISKAGEFSFTILPTSTHYDRLQKMKTIVCVYYFDELIFRGRVLTIETRLSLERSITCEGDLAFFMDTIDYPRHIHDDDVENEGWQYGDTLQTFMTDILTEHNYQMNGFGDDGQREPEKVFELGTIGVLNRTPTAASDEDKLDSDPHKKSYHSHSDAKQMGDLMIDELVDRYGGYLRTRTESGIHYLDFLDLDTGTAESDILFGVNLVDISVENATDNPYSVVIPIGKDGLKVPDVEVEEIDEHGDIVVKWVPFEVDDPAAVALYGRIIKPLEFSEIDNTSQLQRAAENYMLRYPPLLGDTITVTALDIILIDPDASDAFVQIGDRVQVTCEPLGVNVVMNCLQATYDLQNPENNEYKLGTYIPESEEAARTSYTSKMNIAYAKYQKKAKTPGYYETGDTTSGTTVVIK